MSTLRASAVIVVGFVLGEPSRRLSWIRRGDTTRTVHRRLRRRWQREHDHGGGKV